MLLPMATPKKSLRIQELLRRLKKSYGDAECALTHKNAFELLVATILSAQCTDVRVNMVTPALFKNYPSPKALAAADPADIEDLVRTTGFFRNKTKNIIGMAQRLNEAYEGEVPKTMDDLLTLPGVARKTANVVLGVAYHLAHGVVVDTHVKRLSHRLGLTQHADPVKVERDLMAVLPRANWIQFSHLLIYHGRNTCVARKPKCETCPLQDMCPSAGKAD